MPCPYDTEPLLEFPNRVSRTFVAFEKERSGPANGSGDGYPVQQLAAIVARRIDAVFRGAPRQRLILSAHQKSGNRFDPFGVGPASQRPAHVHREAAAGYERNAFLAF